MTTSTHQRIYTVVRRIPRGWVATYGQVAALARLPRQARLVGYALHALPTISTVPWHRVINALGQVSVRKCSGGDAIQRVWLELEGVRFDARGRVDLGTFQWRPGRGARPSTARRRKRRIRQAEA